VVATGVLACAEGMVRSVEGPAEARKTEKVLPRGGRRVDAAICGFVFTVALVAYLRTMRPTFGWGDSSELITAAYHLGVGHSPGYPTWMLVAYPFAHVPMGDVAFRVNFMNALLGAAAIPLLYALFGRISGSRAAAFVGALAFAFSATFWDVTTEADVFALHVCFAALIMLGALKWREAGNDRWLYAVAWLVGISLGNHALTALMIPALVYLVWSERGWRFLLGRRAVACVVMLLLGLSVYAYVPIRGMANPPPHVNNPHSAAEFWDQLTAPGARAAMFDREWTAVARKAMQYVLRVPVELGYAGCALGLVGLVLLWRRDRRVAAFLLLVAGLTVAYASNFSIFDIYMYYVPLYLVGAAFLAVGAKGALDLAAAVMARLGGDGRAPAPAWRSGLVTALLLTVPFTLYTGHVRAVDGSGDFDSERFARAVFEEVEPGALILADWWTIAPMGYLRYVEGERGDVTMFPGPSIYVDEGFIDFAREDFLRRYDAVYFVEELTYRGELLRERYFVVPEGPVARVLVERPDPSEVVAEVPARPIARFGDEVGLAGAEVEERTLRPGECLDFTLYWTPLEGYRGEVLEAIVFVQSEEGGRIWQETNLLAHDLYRRDRWEAGMVLRERHRIYLREAAAAGQYGLYVRVRERGESSCLECDRAVGGPPRRDYGVGEIRVAEAQEYSIRGRMPAVVALVRR
jgi:hypothetical protein